MLTPGFELANMRGAVEAGRVEWQRHVLERMMEREISRRDVLEVLLNGERIEDHPDDYPLPGALFSGYVASRPFHVVAAFNSERATVAVITTYEPDLIHFEDDFRTRKKP